MADAPTMSAQQLVRKVLTDEHADLLREGVAFLLGEIMEYEVAEKTGAGYLERSDERVNQRNGYRERRFDTRAGTVELAIPRLRSGSYFPSFLEPRTRGDMNTVTVSLGVW